MSTYQYFIVEQSERTATVTFHRPKALNALSDGLLQELDSILHTLEKASELSLVFFKGAGKAFIAGADIKEIQQIPAGEGAEFASRGQNLFSRLHKAHFLTVAVVDGFALGGGCEFALACDIRIGTENARLGLPEVSLGLIPGYGGTQRLAPLIGRGRALWMMSSATQLKGQQAYDFGLLDLLVEHDQLDDELERFSQSILANSSHAIRALKVALPRSQESQAEGFRREAQCFEQCMGSSDGQEGVAAFIEKRRPQFG